MDVNAMEIALEAQTRRRRRSVRQVREELPLSEASARNVSNEVLCGDTVTATVAIVQFCQFVSVYHPQ